MPNENRASAPKYAVASVLLTILELALIMRYRGAYLALRRKRGVFPRFAAPRRLTDKIQWRKVFDRNPVFPVLQDKRAAKRIVMETSPRVRVPEELWAGERPADIPFETFTEPYVIKTSHGCGHNILVHDPSTVDRQSVVERSEKFLARRFGKRTKHHVGEWAYRDIPACLFVEEMLIDHAGKPPAEIKLTVANGRTVSIFLQPQGCGPGKPFAYLDREFRRLDIEAPGYTAAGEFPRPKRYDSLRADAERLGSLADMLRVDFYLIGDEYWFGEFAVYPMSGRQVWDTPEPDFQWGARWDILAAYPFTGDVSPPMRVYRWCLEQFYRRHGSPPRENDSC